MKLETIINILANIASQGVEEDRTDYDIYEAIQNKLEKLFIEDIITLEQNAVLVNEINDCDSVDDLMHQYNSDTFKNKYKNAKPLVMTTETVLNILNNISSLGSSCDFSKEEICDTLQEEIKDLYVDNNINFEQNALLVNTVDKSDSIDDLILKFNSETFKDKLSKCS